MKIVIPVDEKNIKTSVCPSFGRTPYFMVYDTENKQCNFLNFAYLIACANANFVIQYLHCCTCFIIQIAINKDRVCSVAII